MAWDMAGGVVAKRLMSQLIVRVGAAFADTPTPY